MKATITKLAILSFFLFAINTISIKAETGTSLYHNVEKKDNIISTTYFKGNNNENLKPFKKKVDFVTPDGVCVSKVTYIWNMNNKDWIPVDKLDFEYNGSKVTKISRYAWDNRNNKWNNPEHISY